MLRSSRKRLPEYNVCDDPISALACATTPLRRRRLPRRCKGWTGGRNHREIVNCYRENKQQESYAQSVIHRPTQPRDGIAGGVVLSTAKSIYSSRPAPAPLAGWTERIPDYRAAFAPHIPRAIIPTLGVNDALRAAAGHQCFVFRGLKWTRSWELHLAELFARPCRPSLAKIQLANTGIARWQPPLCHSVFELCFTWTRPAIIVTLGQEY